MLQQTQVATVIPYYHQFLRRFPTVETLSDAPVSDVLDCWAGLGYYTRAKNLHAGARQVVRQFGGKLPTEQDALRQIAGIGRYTAGAIASIAFDRPAPIVDGNVVRVLCRYFGIRQDPRTPEIQRKLWQLAGDLVPAKSPGDFNQSMMELGATVCLPRSPLCGECPIASGCIARQKNWQEQIPPARRSIPRKKILYLCAVLRKGNSVLLARRPLTGLLPGLWEFPGGEAAKAVAKKQELRRLLEERLGIQTEDVRRGVVVRQTLSHRELEIRAFHCRWTRPIPGRLAWYLEMRWIPIKRLEKIGLTAGMAGVASRLFSAEPSKSPPASDRSRR